MNSEAYDKVPLSSLYKQRVHPLDGSKLKIEQAKRHVDSLQRSVVDFFARNPYVISQKHENLGTIYQLHLMKPLPREWGLIVGDVASNLRASLDYVVFQLSLPVLEQSTDPRDLNVPQFPICDTRRAYCDRKRDISLVPRDRQWVIEQLQPYHKGRWPELDLLSVLRDVSNADKHRLLTPTFSEVTFGLSVGEKVLPRSRFRFDERGDGFVTIITERVRAKVGGEFKPNLAPQVALDVVRTRRGRITTEPFRINILEDIHKFIRDEVLPRFEGFFPE